MENIDLKVVGVVVLLSIIAVISLSNWEQTSLFIFSILSSEKITTGIWGGLLIFLIIHYFRNRNTDDNIISEKEGLEKPIDYLQFLFTYGAIGLTLQTTTKELFAQLNFTELSKCRDLSNFDCFGFLAVIIVLSYYSYNKVEPVVMEALALRPKEKINIVEQIEDTNL